MRKRQLEGAAYAAAFLVVAATAWGAWYWSALVSKRLAYVSEGAASARALAERSAELRAALPAAEVGVRNYAVTRRQSFLKDYDAAVGVVPVALRELRAASALPAERQLVDALAPLVETRLSELRGFARLPAPEEAVPGRVSQVKAVIDRNARTADALSDVVGELEKRVSARRAEIDAERAAVASAAALGARLQGLASIVLATAVFALLLKQIRSRRAAEDSAAGKEDLMRLVFQSIAEGVIVADADGRALVFNPAAERMLGGRPLQADTGRWDEIEGLYHADGQRALRPDEMPLVRALSGQTTDGLEVCVRSGPGGDCRYLLVAGRPLRAAPGELRGGVVVFTEITARKKSDAEIRRLNRDLQSSVAEMTVVNRELESFTSSVSHGLRAPLRAVDGFARLLEQKTPERDAEQARLLSVIRVNATRMGRLMDDLLAYTNLLRRPLKASRVEMEPLARHTFDEARRMVEGAAARLELEPLPPASGDAELLRELLRNLLANALKFSRGAHEPRVVVGTAGGNGKTIYFVRDNGVGFNMRYAHRLFGVFQRLHGGDEFEGAGMGLAIARRIVERHGGQIWANAEEGRGAAFYFSLPSAEQEEPRGSAS